MPRIDYINHSHIVLELNDFIVNKEKTKVKDKSIIHYKIYDQIVDIPELLKKISNIDFYIEPNLPIDLICYESKGETDEETGKEQIFIYYTIYLVVSTINVPDKLNDRILFYKYYLSRIISPKRLEFVLVTLFNTKDVDRDFLDSNGIGYSKFIRNTHKFKVINPPKSQRDQMACDFKQENPQDIPLFFDRYIHDAVGAIAGITPADFGKRYIDKQVLNKVLELKNISYHNRISLLINEHLSEKGNEYEFTSEVFSTLWESLIGIPYKDFLEKFEPVLIHVFSEKINKSGRIYRDHYIHQFQVFLTGLPIIDLLYNRFLSKYQNPEIIWLIISSFHDMGYPVQLYDKWSGDFFQSALNVPKNLSHLELKSSFVEESFMCCTHSLVARICSTFRKDNLTGDWLSEKRELVKFFFRKITEAKNHSIISSISLLKMIQTDFHDSIKIDNLSYRDIFDNIIKPAAMAIAIHDNEIFNELHNKEIWDSYNKETPIPVLKFEDDPLSFLLIFCDSIQEWGRPSKTYVKNNENNWKRFYLKNLNLDNNGVDVTIWTPNDTKCQTFFQKKQDELRDVQKFLQHPADFKFTIRLRDKNNEGEDFTMEGISN